MVLSSKGLFLTFSRSSCGIAGGILSEGQHGSLRKGSKQTWQTIYWPLKAFRDYVQVMEMTSAHIFMTKPTICLSWLRKDRNVQPTMSSTGERSSNPDHILGSCDHQILNLFSLLHNIASSLNPVMTSRQTWRISVGRWLQGGGDGDSPHSSSVPTHSTAEYRGGGNDKKHLQDERGRMADV